MYIHISFIPLQDFDVIYYFLCFSLILKVEFNYKMKWKCIFSEISPQSNPLRELITPPTELAGPGGRPCRPTGGDCRVSRADYVSTQPYRVHSLDDGKTGEYRRYDLADLANFLVAVSLADLTDLDLADASAGAGDLCLLGLFDSVAFLVVLVVDSLDVLASLFGPHVSVFTMTEL